MMCRILTEDKNRERTIRLISRFFQGFTVLTGQGYWQGIAENCLIIEVSGVKLKEVKFLVGQIKLKNHQQAVLIQCINSKDIFI